jgi:hypothetical protein
MKLVESDVVHADDDGEVTLPPRPERRRVYTSFLVTFSVLVATVFSVYHLFPPRDNELLTVAIDAYQQPGPYEIERPSDTQLLAWGTGVVGERAPFPAPAPGITLVGVRKVKILNRPAAMVRYRFEDDGSEVSYFVSRPRDVPPRRYQREDGDLHAVSWRSGRWTLVLVGPAASRDRWADEFGAP